MEFVTGFHVTVSHRSNGTSTYTCTTRNKNKTTSFLLPFYNNSSKFIYLTSP